MAEFVRLLYASLVVGLPLAYVTWNTLRRRQPLRLLAILVGLFLILLFPGRLLPFIWVLLFGFMGVCLAIFAFYTYLNARLLFFARSRQVWPEAEASPKIAVLIPARDEARVILGCLDSLLHSAYPADRLDVIVIDDGSVDETAQLVASYQAHHPNVHLLVRSPSAVRGKAAALNDALATVDAEFICILDADHQVAETLFSMTLPHFRDPQVGGVQTRKIGRNWSDNVLTRLIELELQGWQYAFLDAKSQSHLIFGTGCIFRAELLQHLGGFNNDLATEDLEVSFRIYEAGYKIKFESGTYTTNELVSDWKSFFRQRYRWARGTTQAIPLHWRSFYQSGRSTLREKLDFSFFLVLLCMMIVPYLQIATHALALVEKIDLPLTDVVPLSYVVVIVAFYLTAGLRNQRESGGKGPQGFLNLLFLASGMCFYYCSLFLIANLKAFLDEFVIRAPYRPSKAEHWGTERKRQWKELARPRPAKWSLEKRLVLISGRHAPDSKQLLTLYSTLHKVDWRRVEESASFHGVAGFIHANLVQHRLETTPPPSIRHALLAFRRAVLARNLYLQQAWQEIAHVFTQTGIEVITLKGIRLINHSYPLDIRPMHDIDLLVKEPRVQEAGHQLEALGYQPVRNPTFNGKAWYTQRPFRHPTTGVVIDLHWELINIFKFENSSRQIYALPTEDVWKRAQPLGTSKVLYDMAPEDLVLHNALHGAIHYNCFSLSHLVDLREILRASNQMLDWKSLVALASAYRIKSPVYLALMLSRELIDAPVPDVALKALQPPLYRRLWFWSHLRGGRTVLDSRMPSQLGRDLKWGWGTIVMADSLADSLRAMRANLAFVLATKGWDEV